VVGTLINTLLRHADRVKIACMAQLVNVIAPIMTRNGGPAWKQTIFWPLYHASKFGRGTSLQVKLDVPFYENKTFGQVPWLDASAIRSEDGKSVTVFVVNRSPDQTIEFSAAFAGLENLRLVGHTELHHGDIKAVNDEAHPNNVAPVEKPVKGTTVGQLAVAIAPLSWNVLRFEA